MTTQFLRDIPQRRRFGENIGIPSVCSAHPLVLEAALRNGLATDAPVLIEATCNQVNQHGGYTGMTPADFRQLVEGMAAKVGYPISQVILGGDHLGPNPWKDLPAAQAMDQARGMISAYVEAGFTKLHLDTSMGCSGEPAWLPDEITADRAASLAAVSLDARRFGGHEPAVYIIGTEVPAPGGAIHEIDALEPTRPAALAETIEVHRQAFDRHGAQQAFEQAIGVVVQPGVEFGNDNVAIYDPPKARELRAALDRFPQFIFEAHSTDYQPATALADLVRDGFAILKVGPWLTFALREAFYGLDQIAYQLQAGPAAGTLAAKMDQIMLEEPGNWRSHYHGDEKTLRVQRHFSYSDRIRYYWPRASASAAVAELMESLEGKKIPETLISQYLGAESAFLKGPPRPGTAP